MSKLTIVEGNSNDKDNVRVIMVKGEKGEMGDLNHNDIVDNLTSTATDKVLSANQGKVLKDLIDENKTTLENKTYYFNTVAEMVAYDLNVGDMVFTKGYYEANDYGGAKYTIIDDVGSINSMLYITLNNGLYARIIYDNQISSKQLGIENNGTTDVTAKLNAFYSISLNATKVLNKGVYLTSGTVYIKGLWRQSSSGSNNGFVEFIFDKATINYQGTTDGVSLVLYNMFHQKVKGLSIARYSASNEVDVIGCWHTTFQDCDIQNLNVTSNSSILNGLTYNTVSIQHITFENVYVLGTLSISPSSSSNYINGVYFINCDINSSNLQYCVHLLGTSSKQEIVFDRCDLSYATNYVFLVDSEQTGRCSVTLKNCYLDSNIPVFANRDMKGVIFSNYDSIFAANGVNTQVVNKPFDYLRTINLSTYSAYANSLPTFNVNLVKNGNFQTTGTESGNYNYLLGPNSTILTKSWVSTNKNIFGRARHVVINQDGKQTINIASINAPWRGVYTAMVRYKITAGNCETELKFGDQYTTVFASRTGNDEYILITNKDHHVFSEGDSLNLVFYITKNADEDCEIDFYEVVVCPGTLLLPNPPLHANAIL